MVNNLPPKYGVIRAFQSTRYAVIERIDNGPEYGVLLEGFHTEEEAFEYIEGLPC